MHKLQQKLSQENQKRRKKHLKNPYSFYYSTSFFSGGT
jgi:hypothetical protein